MLSAIKKIAHYFSQFWHGLPIQLLLLHLRRYQVLLLFWYILFATISGHFLNTYGAVALFLAPEYMGEVNFISTSIVGITVGVFIMSWNITTFILHTNNLHFLATTAQPFLKYCINNALLPLSFLAYYFVQTLHYERAEELNSWWNITCLVAGFMAGFTVALLIAFLYFFVADKGIYHLMMQQLQQANNDYNAEMQPHKSRSEKEEPALYCHPDWQIKWFLSARLRIRSPRNTKHYDEILLEDLFRQHHFAAVFAILVAFIALITVGFFCDAPFFQLPAAASITLLFAVLIAFSGAFSLFAKCWSIPLVVLVYALFNFLYVHDIFDPRNKVYGIAYPPKSARPSYNTHALMAQANYGHVQADKAKFLQLLQHWKQNQRTNKPVLYLINVSGGGLRSAAFVMNVLQHLDSALGGQLMRQTLLINGASGGMLGAAYFRELYFRQQYVDSSIRLQDPQYVRNISKDLLNPLFSSFVTRDIIGPVQKFQINGNEYVKDRGYAFEQQLNFNTHGCLNKSLKEYTSWEAAGKIPTMIFNPVVRLDGKKMIIATKPLCFLMKPLLDSNRYENYQPDAVDFQHFFATKDCLNMTMLSALRMNATFPYVLPNVWLPTNPVIDVVDAGLRDNNGQETSLRVLEHFRQWFMDNTAQVVLIQIKDVPNNNWGIATESPHDGIVDFITNPLTFLQNNWFTIQNYRQQEQLESIQNNFGNHLKQVCFQYIPRFKSRSAGMSFHLTSAEKLDIAASMLDSINQSAISQLLQHQ